MKIKNQNLILSFLLLFTFACLAGCDGDDGDNNGGGIPPVTPVAKFSGVEVFKPSASALIGNQVVPFVMLDISATGTAKFSVNAELTKTGESPIREMWLSKSIISTEPKDVNHSCSTLGVEKVMISKSGIVDLTLPVGKVNVCVKLGEISGNYPDASLIQIGLKLSAGDVFLESQLMVDSLSQNLPALSKFYRVTQVGNNFSVGEIVGFDICSFSVEFLGKDGLVIPEDRYPKIITFGVSPPSSPSLDLLNTKGASGKNFQVKQMLENLGEELVFTNDQAILNEEKKSLLFNGSGGVKLKPSFFKSANGKMVLLYVSANMYNNEDNLPHSAITCSDSKVSISLVGNPEVWVFEDGNRIQ